MPNFGERVKNFLNEQADVRFAQVGHSDAMTRDAKREAWWWWQARTNALRRRSGLLSGWTVVWTTPGRAELVPIEVHKPGAGEVTVEVHTSVVSTGTERANYLRLPNTKVGFPHRPGYSAAGVVLAVGRGVTNVGPGDRVAVRNVPHASVATAPAAHIYPVPAGVPLEAAAMIFLGVIAGQGVRRAGLQPREPFCVLGAGMIGLLAQRMATAAGAGPATVIARSGRKEARARAGGTARFFSTLEQAHDIEALAASAIIEATGDPGAVSLAIEAAGAGGRIVLLGSPRGETVDLPLATIRRKQLHLIGAHVGTLANDGHLAGLDAYRREADSFLALLASGRLSVADLIDVVVDPREADSFYRGLAGGAVAARFDWTRLPAETRVRRGRLARLPDLRGRGADPERRPLLPRRSGGPRTALVPVGDPFGKAAGKLRIGLLGCGDIAVHNAAAAREAPNIELVACYDPVSALAENLASTYGCEAAPTSEALLERRDVDAVLLSVPHHLHCPLGIQVAEAGKHLIVEKPLASNLAAAVQLVRAAEDAGVTLSVCFPHRYQPNIVATRRLVAAGALGEFTGAFLRFVMDKPPSYWLGGFSGRAQSSWRSSREQAGGGVLIMNLAHYLDLVRHLAGVEAEMVAAYAQVDDATAEVEDTVSLTLRYTNGALGSLFAAASLRGSAGVQTELRLWGHGGQIVVEPDPLVYTLRALDGLRTNRWQALGPLPTTNIRAVYLSRLATAIAQQRPPEVTAQDGLAVQAIIEAAYRSSDLARGIRPSELIDEARA